MINPRGYIVPSQYFVETLETISLAIKNVLRMLYAEIHSNGTLPVRWKTGESATYFSVIIRCQKSWKTYLAFLSGLTATQLTGNQP